MADLHSGSAPGAGSPARPADREQTVSRRYATGGSLERIIGALQAGRIAPVEMILRLPE